MHYLTLVLILSTAILSNVMGDAKYTCDKDHNDDSNGGCDCTLDTLKWASVKGNY